MKTQETRKATVSVRNMPLDVWKKARKVAIDRQISMTQYIMELIESDSVAIPGPKTEIDTVDLANALNLILNKKG